MLAVAIFCETYPILLSLHFLCDIQTKIDLCLSFKIKNNAYFMRKITPFDFFN